jgi:O-antigen ligase
MKSDRKPPAKTKRQSQPGTDQRFSILAVALLAIPFVALTPNFFIIPTLSYQGNATQEAVVAWASCILLVLAVIVLARTRSSLGLDRYSLRLLVPLFVFLLWTLITAAWAPETAEAIRLFSIWLCFAVYFSVALLELDRRSAWWLFYSIGAVILILTFSQFLEYWMYSGEMLGVFFSHGITAEMLALMLPLQLTVYLTTKKQWLAVVTFLLAGAGATATLLTLRRGALLGVGLATLFICLALVRGWLRLADKWRLIVAGCAIVLLLGGLFTFKRQELTARIRGALVLQRAESGRVTELGLTSRSVKWLTAWEMGKRNPLLGVGNGGFTADYGAYRRYFAENPRYAKIAAVAETEDYDEIRSPNAHSEFLQIFSELGLIGFLLGATFVAMVVAALWKARKSVESELPLGALAGLIAFGASASISGLAIRYSPGTVMLACVAGLGCAFARTSTPESSESPEATNFAIPKAGAILGLSLLTLLNLALALRARDVLHSQQAQSQIDFKFSNDSPAINEGLLRRYQQVLMLDQNNSGAHLGLGLLLFQLKRPSDAITHIEYARAHSYGRPFSYVLLAFAHEQTGDLTKLKRSLPTVYGPTLDLLWDVPCTLKCSSARESPNRPGEKDPLWRHRIRSWPGVGNWR